MVATFLIQPGLSRFFVSEGPFVPIYNSFSDIFANDPIFIKLYSREEKPIENCW